MLSYFISDLTLSGLLVTIAYLCVYLWFLLKSIHSLPLPENNILERFMSYVFPGILLYLRFFVIYTFRMLVLYAAICASIQVFCKLEVDQAFYWRNYFFFGFFYSFFAGLICWILPVFFPKQFDIILVERWRREWQESRQTRPQATTQSAKTNNSSSSNRSEPANTTERNPPNNETTEAPRPSKPTTEVIKINTATAKEIKALDSLLQTIEVNKIIQERRKSGDFKDMNDLCKRVNIRYDLSRLSNNFDFTPSPKTEENEGRKVDF